MKTLEDITLEVLREEADEDLGNNEYGIKLYTSDIVDIHEMSISQILEEYDVLSSIENKVLDVFYSYGGYDHFMKDIRGQVEDKIREEELDIEIDPEVINETIEESISFEIDLENELMKYDVKINLLVDFGDSNYDFTLNEYDTLNTEDALENSSLLKLIEMLGFDKEKFLRYLYYEGNDFSEPMEVDEMQFFEDLYHEILNTTTSMNALTFFVQLNLKDLFILSESKLDYVEIHKDTKCGLFDPWNGAGSLLEVNITKDITLEAKNVILIVEGASELYDIKDVYGIDGDFWTDAEFILK